MSAELDNAIDVIAGHVTDINDNGVPVFGRGRNVLNDGYLAGKIQIAKQHGLTEAEFTKRVCEAFAKRVKP